MTTDEDEAATVRENRRVMWGDVHLRLEVARSAVEAAQALLEDLREPDYADRLQPLVDNLRQAATEAEEASRE